MRRAIQWLTARAGIHVSAVTDEARLRQIASRYWPQESGHPLRRLGRQGDGGYLVPDCLKDIDSCLSPGVETVADFERDLETLGIRSHLIDGSVAFPPAGINPLSFTKRYLGPISKGELLSIEDWIAQIGIQESDELVLQMDIEGHEYATVLSTPRRLMKQFRIIVVELHNLNSIGNPAFMEIFEAFSDVLLKDHTVVHLHPNNTQPPHLCNNVLVHSLLEVTLLRNDWFTRERQDFCTQFPNPLDARCTIGRQDFTLSRPWYASSPVYSPEFGSSVD